LPPLKNGGLTCPSHLIAYYTVIMKDFTLSAYERYLKEIKRSFSLVLRFDEFLQKQVPPQSFCIIRHDVDRRPGNALLMAEIEKRLAVRSTYYFRVKHHAFKPDIIRRISEMGHEVGYHYECLTDSRGDVRAALKDFEIKLLTLREIAPVNTISMHGSPLSRFDNRDLWRDGKNHDLLLQKHSILGEIYLDIDYSEIAYISDTGRNWSRERSNIRDRVESGLNPDFADGEGLLDYLKARPHPRIIMLFHPERWNERALDRGISYFFDLAVNSCKQLRNLALHTK